MEPPFATPHSTKSPGYLCATWRTADSRTATRSSDVIVYGRTLFRRDFWNGEKSSGIPRALFAVKGRMISRLSLPDQSIKAEPHGGPFAAPANPAAECPHDDERYATRFRSTTAAGGRPEAAGDGVLFPLPDCLHQRADCAHRRSDCSFPAPPVRRNSLARAFREHDSGFL